jgi:CheY-like chemotaxis protein
LPPFPFTTLHLWKFRDRYADKIDAWEIANRDDLFEVVGLERFPYLANSDFHERHHLTAWKSLVFGEKEKESIKEAIIKRKVAILFFNDMKGRHAPLPILPIKDRAIMEEKDVDATVEATILIVDDERDLVEMLAYNLEKRGYRAIKAYDGFEAWQKLESERPDLLILDLMMPNLDGWELCRMYRALVNPLSNALKYTPRGGEIEVSIHAYFNKKGTGVLEGWCKSLAFFPSCHGCPYFKSILHFSVAF